MFLEWGNLIKKSQPLPFLLYFKKQSFLEVVTIPLNIALYFNKLVDSILRRLVHLEKSDTKHTVLQSLKFGYVSPYSHSHMTEVFYCIL
ncbi:hypothetical protein T11_4150 [Trichinella zimbabwensis]|uniref:Uncharacterized protein n=1 Tax=Trichinella zimbabwensis TaxID=268475 RepID=A0A0V1H799_9BILA|nr:hypothetical protein T11_4150 [Trichinella zimbabwensis]